MFPYDISILHVCIIYNIFCIRHMDTVTISHFTFTISYFLGKCSSLNFLYIVILNSISLINSEMSNFSNFFCTFGISSVHILCPF